MLFKLLRKNASEGLSQHLEPDLSPSAPPGSCSSATPESPVPAAGISAVTEKMHEQIGQLTGKTALQAVTDQANTTIDPPNSVLRKLDLLLKSAAEVNVAENNQKSTEKMLDAAKKEMTVVHDLIKSKTPEGPHAAVAKRQYAYLKKGGGAVEGGAASDFYVACKA